MRALPCTPKAVCYLHKRNMRYETCFMAFKMHLLHIAWRSTKSRFYIVKKVIEKKETKNVTKYSKWKWSSSTTIRFWCLCKCECVHEQRTDFAFELSMQPFLSYRRSDNCIIQSVIRMNGKHTHWERARANDLLFLYISYVFGGW